MDELKLIIFYKYLLNNLLDFIYLMKPFPAIPFPDNSSIRICGYNKRNCKMQYSERVKQINMIL